MMSKPKLKYIESIGLELEGGICEEDVISLENTLNNDQYIRYSVGYDGSVWVNKPYGKECRWIHDVEIKFWSYDINELEDFVKTLFNTSFRQNPSCGNHHHFKFKSNLYIISLLTNYEFIDYYIINYINTFKDIPKYMDRLYNRYCRSFRDIYDLIDNITSYRYYAVNFQSVIKHGTLEIRIMPYAKNSNEYMYMLMFNINTIESYLNKVMKKKDKKNITLDIGDLTELIEEEITPIRYEVYEDVL